MTAPTRMDLSQYFGQSPTPGFDFTFDCPVYLLGPETGGYLLSEDRALCLWTDADAASIFVERSKERLLFVSSLSLVEIETDNDLLSLLTEASQAGIKEVAVDVASASQTTVRMLYVVDLIDMQHSHSAESD